MDKAEVGAGGGGHGVGDTGISMTHTCASDAPFKHKATIIQLSKPLQLVSHNFPGPEPGPGPSHVLSISWAPNVPPLVGRCSFNNTPAISFWLVGWGGGELRWKFQAEKLF